MGMRGPKPKFASAKELETSVKRYFTNCEAEGVMPDYAGMLIYLDISESTARNLQNEGHADHEEYRRVFEQAQLRRESWLTRKMTAEPKLANGCMNALKQKKNGGYIERPQNEAGETKLTINLVGLGGEKNFKG